MPNRSSVTTAFQAPTFTEANIHPTNATHFQVTSRAQSLQVFSYILCTILGGSPTATSSQLCPPIAQWWQQKEDPSRHTPGYCIEQGGPARRACR